MFFNDPRIKASTATTFSPAASAEGSKAAAGASPAVVGPVTLGASGRSNKCCADTLHPTTKICQTIAQRGVSTTSGRGIPKKFHSGASSSSRKYSQKNPFDIDISFLDNELQYWSVFRFKSSSGSNAKDQRGRDVKFSRGSYNIAIEFWKNS